MKVQEPLDLLLIFPPWISERFGEVNAKLPPLGILAIAAVVREQGFIVDVIDVHAEHIDESQLRRRVRQTKPKFVGLTVLTSMVVSVHAIAKLVKEESKDTIVVVGGVHAEIAPNDMLKNSNIDLVIKGDGEDAMLEIMQGKSWSLISGASYRIGQTVKHNPPRTVTMDLDKYPFPAYDLVDFDNYFAASGSYRRWPAINIQMTRGCPGKCAFCNSARTTLRARSAKSIFSQIKLLHTDYGIEQVHFYDDTFTVMKKNCLEFCELMIESQLDVTWNAYIRGDCFSPDLAIKMKEAGCHQVLLGIETANAEIAKKIGKPINNDKYRETVALAQGVGMEVRGFFIIGHLGETQETMQETLQFAIDLDLDFFELSVSTPYPGTQLYQEVSESNMLTHRNWHRYGIGEVLIEQPQITADEIYKFQDYAFSKFYLRPRAIAKLLKSIHSWQHVKHLVKTAMVVFGITKEGVVNYPLLHWNSYQENDFFDIELVDDVVDQRLTHEIRQEIPIRIKETAVL